MPRFMYIGGAQIPITPPATDPFFSNVKLLMGFEGSDGSTAFVDESASPHTLTANGNAQIDTAKFKFGGSSGLFDGTSDYITFPRTDFVLGSNQFTCECWVWFNALPTGSNAGDIFMCHNTFASRGWRFGRSDGGGEIYFVSSSNGSTDAVLTVSSGAGITTGQWYFVAVDRDASNNLRLYLNGAMLVKQTDATNFFNSGASASIGGQPDNLRSLDGWLDEVRITVGVARYASDAGFVVPTEAFPRS